MLVASVAMHVDNTRSLHALLKIALRNVAAMQALVLRILNHEVVLNALDPSECMRKLHARVVRVLAPRRSNNETEEEIALHIQYIFLIK